MNELKQETGEQTAEVCSKGYDDIDQFNFLDKDLKPQYEKSPEIHKSTNGGTSDHLQEITEKVDTAKPAKRNVILLGKSGIGKSSLGNKLLGTKAFRTSMLEDRRTKECMIESKGEMLVVDTPGFFQANTLDVAVAKNIFDTIKDLSINLYILILSADERLSGDEKESLEFIKSLFGDNVTENMILVFTAKDSLEDDEFQYPRSLPKLKYFVLDCKNEEAGHIRDEILNEKYKQPQLLNEKNIDYDSIEKEDRRRRDSQKLDVDSYLNAIHAQTDLTLPVS